MPFQGGTGTSAIPTYGKVLVGNSSGTYSLMATSSLGITSGASFSGTTGQIEYFSGTNTAVGTSTIFISTAGNVGIGSTSPNHTLTVGGTGIFSNGAFNESSTYNGIFMGKPSGATSIQSGRLLFTTGTAAKNWQIDNDDGTFRWFLPGIVHMSLSATTLSLPVANLTVSGTGNSSIAGRLGIGTTSPFTSLGVAGTITANNINATSTTATSLFSGNIQVNATSTLATTTTSMLNGTIVVDGVHYAKTSAGINSAIANMSTLGGGTVYLPAGTYTITTRINPKSNVHVVGAGKGATNLVGSVASDWIFYYSSGSVQLTNFSITDMSFDLQNGSNASGIQLSNASSTSIERVSLINGAAGGWFIVYGTLTSATDGILNYNNKVIDVDMTNHAGSLEALLVFNAKNTQIIRPTLSNISSPGIGLWQKTYNTVIDGFHCLNSSGQSIYYSITTDQTIITNPTFENCSTGIQGANISDNGAFGYTQAVGLEITNPIFKGGANSDTATAIQLGGVNNASIQGGLIENYQIGVGINNGNNGNLGTTSNFTIDGTQFRNNNASADFHILHGAIMITGNPAGCLNGSIVNTKIYNDLGGVNQRYPIVFDGAQTWDCITIANNRLSAATTTGGTSIALGDGALLGTRVDIHGNQDYSGTNPFQALSYNTSGSVGIASSSPAARFSVNSMAGDLFSFWVGSTSAPWLRVSNTGFGTTTLAGLNISGQATSTSNVGFNITGGCFAIAGTCLSQFINTLLNGGTGTTTFSNGGVVFSDATKLTQDTSNFFWDNTNNTLGLQGGTGVSGVALMIGSGGNTPYMRYGDSVIMRGESGNFGIYPLFADRFFKFYTSGSVVNSQLSFNGTSNSYIASQGGSLGISTTTSYYNLTIASTTGPQLALSAGGGLAQWTLRNAGGSFYLATTSVAGTATSTVSALTIDSDNIVRFGNSTATCIALTGSSALCDGTDATGAGGGSSQWATSTVDSNAIYPAGATKVGIGSSTPMSVLSVVGTTTIAGAVQVLDAPLFVWDKEFTNASNPFINDSGFFCGMGFVPGLTAGLGEAFRGGCDNTLTNWTTSKLGFGSFAFGNDVEASGVQSSAFGDGTTASGENSHALGDRTIASGKNSFAMGQQVTASGEGSFIGGNNSTMQATGTASFVWGSGDTQAGSGGSAIAMGVEQHAYGDGSLAIGGDANTAYSYCSTVGGNALFCYPEYSGIFAGASNVITFGSAPGDNSFSGILAGVNNTVSAPRSMTIGSDISNTAADTITIGTGVVGTYPTGLATNPLVNNQTKSIYLGQNSNLPTLVITQASGVGTTGKVGVGSTTPWGLLSVNPNALGSGVPEFVVGSSSATHFIVTGNGNVGINDSTPENPLNVVGIINVRESDDGGDAVKLIPSSSAGQLIVYRVNSPQHQITGDGHTIFNIQQQGGARDFSILGDVINPLFYADGGVDAVGIGTSTPLFMLTIASSTAPQLALSAGGGIAQWTQRNAGGNLYFSTTTVAGTATTSIAALEIRNTGEMYAPFTAASGSAQTGYWCYDTNGQFIRTSTTCLISALKYKTDIKPLEVGLEELLAIDFVSYMKKVPLDEADAQRQMGVIADSITNPALKEMLVIYAPDGSVQGFRYEQFTALLGQAIKELNNKVDTGTTKPAEKGINYTWIVIGLLAIGFIYQQISLNRIKK